MSMTKNAQLVENAERSRRTQLTEALASIRGNVSLESAASYFQTFGPWARELNHVNQHITVRPEEINGATKAYTDAATHLMGKLDWPADAIKIIPQGSASTQTLIRPPVAPKFDIDAVGQVDISRDDANDPVKFFETVGEALEELEAIRKKRCWNIPCTSEPFYLEFTPSVPLATVPQPTLASMAPRFLPKGEYLATALAVVDNPTKKWKTSNPAGSPNWVDETANLQLISFVALESASFDRHASIDPVPDQDVEITDTLRVAIRLFKRHRDMCVHRGLIEKDVKPISVIIVTLLTRCYSGLADLNRSYSHPVQLLSGLAELLPGMVDMENGEYHVDNPTVPGENYAERWNDDGGERYNAFVSWCKTLDADMRTILAAKNEQDIKRRVQEVFGCGPNTSIPGGSGGPGLAPANRQPPSAPPKTQGLA